MPRPFGIRLFVLAALFASQIAPPAAAQSPAAEPVKIGDLVVSGSLRTRVESWDWFQGNANNDYTFPGSILRLGLSESKKTFDWQIEFAVPFLLGLPSDAVAAGSQGQLGFGASYFAANNRNTESGMLFANRDSYVLKGSAGLLGNP